MMIKSYNTVVYLLTLLVVVVRCQTGPPIVDTVNGQVQGFTTSVVNGLTSTQFLGIPFAKPPINELRFQKPQPPENWNGIFNATTLGHSCFQMGLNDTGYTYLVPGETYTMSEDCLSLNVYYPGDFNTRNSTAQPKAVMVFIYGGGYAGGTSHDYDGSVLSTNQDIIVVTLNYRIGFYGFITTDNPNEIPGNMGLFDQHAALVWVQENIAAFGGDRYRVTIFGESAGANSVVNHLVSPMSNGLFRRAIIQSTPNMNVVSREQQYQAIADIAVTNWNCKRDVLFECLKGLSVNQINMVMPWDVVPTYFSLATLPVIVDGEFLPDIPINMIRSGRFNKSVDIIIGYTGDDGNIVIQNYPDILSTFIDFSANGTSYNKAQEFIQRITKLVFSGNENIINDILYSEYLKAANTDLETGRKVLDLSTDFFFISRALDIAKSVSDNGGNIFLYEFDFLSENFVWTPSLPGIPLSAGHGDDLFYVFGIAFENGTEQEKIMSWSLMQAWAEFTKTGQPTYLTNDAESVNWKPYSDDESYFLMVAPLTNTSVQVVPRDIQTSARLWYNTIPTIATLQTNCPAQDPPSTVPTEVQGILNLSKRMSDILLITSASGLCFFILYSMILHCYIIRQHGSGGK